ncbi:hypothetical protein ENC21_15205 [Acinetobacter indicus]|nr:hypothetical protein ENC21_15205 [Acinetobacter indicus]
MKMSRFNPIYSTVSYNRNKGVLIKKDYIFIRECLEKHLENMQLSQLDYSKQIDELKKLFIKLDHTIDRL